MVKVEDFGDKLLNYGVRSHISVPFIFIQHYNLTEADKNQIL